MPVQDFLRTGNNPNQVVLQQLQFLCNDWTGFHHMWRLYHTLIQGISQQKLQLMNLKYDIGIAKWDKHNLRLLSSWDVLNLLHTKLGLHILHTVLYTFSKVLTKRNCLTINNLHECKDMKIIYVNCSWRHEYRSNPRCYKHYLSRIKIRPEKNSGPYRIWTHDLRHTGAALHQLSLNKPTGNWSSCCFPINSRSGE